MVAVIAVVLGIILWIALAGAAGTFIGHPSWRGPADDDDEQVDVR
jgi:hypothetical protein